MLVTQTHGTAFITAKLTTKTVVTWVLFIFTLTHFSIRGVVLFKM